MCIRDSLQRFGGAAQGRRPVDNGVHGDWRMGELITVPRTPDGLDKAARRELLLALAELRRAGGPVIRLSLIHI